MKQLQVSVIIPMYNAEQYVGGCIESIQKQELSNLEIICVDDGSSDSTKAIVSEYAKKDYRVKLIECPHKSAGAARNSGIKIATGEYLAILDVDDYYHVDMLATLYDKAKAFDADIVLCKSGEIDENSGEKRDVVEWHIYEEKLPQKEVFSIKDFDKSVSAFQVCVGWAWDKLFKRDFIISNEILFQDQPSINDLLFVYSALAKADRISFVPSTLLDKRIRKKGAITTDYAQTKSHKDFLNALFALKSRLETWGIYDDIKKDYLNYALYFVKYNIEQFYGTNKLKELLNDLKSGWGEKLGIDNIECETEIICESDLVFYKDMVSGNAQEAIWLVQLRNKKEHFLFPYEEVEKGSKIILYGAGNVGRDFYFQIKHSSYCSIQAWVDKNFMQYDSQVICSLDNGLYKQYDYIVVAISEEKVFKQIEVDLLKNGVEKNKIIWRNPKYL